MKMVNRFTCRKGLDLGLGLAILIWRLKMTRPPFRVKTFLPNYFVFIKNAFLSTSSTKQYGIPYANPNRVREAHIFPFSRW